MEPAAPHPGSTDIPLNDTGRAQAKATGLLLARRRWDAVVASPLARAFETASIIAFELGLPAPIPDPSLVERNYGQAEGYTYADMHERFPEGSHVPGREDREDVARRAVPALLKIAQRHPGESVVVVSHGGLIRAVLGAVDPEGEHGSITNGSVHSLRYEDGSFSLIAFDDPIELETAAGEDVRDQNPAEGASR